EQGVDTRATAEVVEDMGVGDKIVIRIRKIRKLQNVNENTPPDRQYQINSRVVRKAYNTRSKQKERYVMIKDDLSIFDTNKTWYFNWKSESRTSFPSLVGIDIDDKSKEIIEAVASVGLITDKQLFYFYKVRKKHLDHMRHIKMLVEHQINIANEKGD